MPKYIDGFVIPVPKSKLNEYRRIAKAAGKIWREHGALDYVESAGDDLNTDFGMSFPRGIRTKAGETVVFSYILYKSRAHRDRVNKQVMQDPRIASLSNSKMPFDCKRMLYGGFKAIVEA